MGSAAGQPNIHEPDKVTFLTLTDHFAPYMAPPHAGRGIYPGWFSRADVIGFDTYPLEGRCRYDRIPWVYQLQRTLVQMAGSKPTFQWIEAGPMEKCFKVDPTPTTLRAETWLAIAGGRARDRLLPRRLGRPDAQRDHGGQPRHRLPRAGASGRGRERASSGPPARSASACDATTAPSTRSR